MLSYKFIIHYSLHFIVPVFIAFFYNKQNWKQNYVFLLSTMLVDLDHLLSFPEVFSPNRCSINFHPLHTYYAVIVYIVFLFPKKTRIFAIGLLFHMFTDLLDCLLM